jgi:hypothetical protein
MPDCAEVKAQAEAAGPVGSPKWWLALLNGRLEKRRPTWSSTTPTTRASTSIGC